MGRLGILYLCNIILADHMKTILLTLLLLFSTTAHASFEDWTKQDQRLYESYITLQAMDLLQAFAMIECQDLNPYCPFEEKNPLMGTHPKKAEVVMFKLAMNFLIYNVLDKRIIGKQRRGTLIALNAISIVPIIHNESIGLGFYIPILPYRQFK